MGMYLNADMLLKIKDEMAAKKVICNTLLTAYESDMDDLKKEFDVSTVDELCQKCTIEGLLSPNFFVDEDCENGYDISYNDDCSYSFVDEIKKMFEQLVPYLDDGSRLELQSDDDGDWYEYYEVQNEQIVKGERHFFYTDNADGLSDNDIADVIIKAAERLKTNPDSKNGLLEKLTDVTSVKNIIDALNM